MKLIVYSNNMAKSQNVAKMGQTWLIIARSWRKNHTNMTRRELALEYFPEKPPVEAVRNLRRWIARCPDLVGELNALHLPYLKSKNLTVRQVRIIKDYLGDP